MMFNSVLNKLEGLVNTSRVCTTRAHLQRATQIPDALGRGELRRDEMAPRVCLSRAQNLPGLFLTRTHVPQLPDTLGGGEL